MTWKISFYFHFLQNVGVLVNKKILFYFDESKMYIMCIRPLVSNTTATLKTRNMFWCFKKGGTGKREKCKTVKHLVFPKLLEDVKSFHLMLIYINLLSTWYLNRYDHQSHYSHNCFLFQSIYFNNLYFLLFYIEYNTMFFGTFRYSEQ